MEYSLVIPCFNEEGTLKLILENTKEPFLNNNIDLILVNNGSTDNTKNLLENLINYYPHARFVNLENNIGYGGGILHGLSFCKGDIIGWTHADLQTDPLDCIRAFKNFSNENYKKIFVKGKRINRPLFDQFFTFGMSIFESILLKKIIYDINAQPTLFSKTFYESWVNPPQDFSLDLYAYYLALKKGFKIKRIKVSFYKRISGISKWNTNFISKLKFIFRTIKFSLRLKYEKRSS